MIQMNENYNRLQGSYLFAEISRRVSDYTKKHSDQKVIKLGIGDVTRPLPKSVQKALKKAVDEMSKPETFQGYGPYAGYQSVREKIAEVDFKSRGVDISADEIFISTGAKEDTANFQELFSGETKIAVQDPVYPVYVDSNVMSGRSGEFVDGRFSNFVYMDGTEENRFKPELPSEKVDLIYLCFPNNPTGKALKTEELKMWVDYALENQALILFDAAYEAFIRGKDIPHSIFEIEGAKKCAVEFRSLSKTAGFTGTRFSYTIIPNELEIADQDGKMHSLRELWLRRQSTKFNGTSYIIQKGAEAVFTPEGQEEVRDLIDYYLGNAKIIREGLESIGILVTGGKNSPYIWFKAPAGMSSWDFFDKLLHDIQVVGTPGEGFGKSGTGYFRLSAFGDRAEVKEAVERIKTLEF